MRKGLLFGLILIATACAPQRGAKPREGSATFKGTTPANTRPAFKPETKLVEGDWTPEKVEVVCAADKCPLQVGALIFAGAAVNHQIPIRRCTAFLVASDMVMSNGHCDGFGKEKGWFVSQRIGGQKEVREITGVPFKRFTPHPKGEKFSSGRPDVALFALNRPLNGMPALRLASGSQLAFNKLIAFAIMHSPSEQKLTIHKAECLVRRHESEFPFEIVESPDMIMSYDCRLEPGTSGSPMFAPGAEEVQALQTGGMDPSARAQSVRETHGRDLLNYEKHWSSLATNVRCLDLPGAKLPTCTVTDEATVARRFREIQVTEQRKLSVRRISGAEAAVQLRPSAYLLSPQQEMRYEVVHTPECRRAQEALKSLPFVIEQVKIQFDDWAAPRIESLSRTNLNADVKSASGTVLEVEISWPAPAGTYVQPDLDLRKKWGGRFHIDLPVCPR